MHSIMQGLKPETVCVTGPKHPSTLTPYDLLRTKPFEYVHFFTIREGEHDLRRWTKKTNGARRQTRRMSYRIKDFSWALAKSIGPRFWTFREQVAPYLLEDKTVIRYSLGDWRIINDFIVDSSSRRRFYAMAKSFCIPNSSYEEYDLVIYLRLSLAIIQNTAEKFRGIRLNRNERRFLEKKVIAFENRAKIMGDKCVIVDINWSDDPVKICEKLYSILRDRGVE